MKNKEFKSIIMFSAAITVCAFIACLFINKTCAAISLASGCVISAVFYYYTKKRYDKLQNLNTYLSAVCAGYYELDIDDNAEGELSVLKNNLYKVIVLLRSTNEQLNKDKIIFPTRLRIFLIS